MTAPSRPRLPAARAGFRRAAPGAKEPAAELPVARVLVDVSLAHLDRPYDYLVAEPDSAAAQPGVRVRVRFAGRLVNGYVVARLAESDHPGRLGFLERVLSAEPVLTAEVAELARVVADRYAGSTADVLRLAVPPRHAKTEAEQPAELPPFELPPVELPTAERADVERAPVERPDVRLPPVERPDVELPPVELPHTPGPDGSGAAGAGSGGGGPGPDGARPEGAAPDGAHQVVDPASEPAGWRRYPAGRAFLSAVRGRRPARAVWQALPGEDWPARFAEAAKTAADTGVGALLIVPDARDLARLDQALTGSLGAGAYVSLAAGLGPAERYRRFLRVSRGEVRVVAGTRAAVFAPVRELGLVALFDDGDDLLAEPRAPYPHAREVLMLRSAARSCALLVGGFARTAEAQLLVESGWAQPIVAGRAEVRAASPRIEAAGDDYSVGADSAAAQARLSPAAFAAARASLKAGAPVLVQVPRSGYVPALACTRCRRRAQCRHCRGPLALTGASGLTGASALTGTSALTGASAAGGAATRNGTGGLLSCRWCGVAEAHFNCPACGSDRLRAVSTGVGRTAEEIGRAFPGIPVVSSSGQKVRASVPDRPALVVATPGAEPFCGGGYGAALLLDGSAMLGRPDLRAAEETLRRWMAAATLVRSAVAGGHVVIGADASLPSVQALIRWDPVGHARTELAARRELGFPPAAAMASIEGDEQAVLGVLDRLAVPPDGEVLGPVALDDLRADDDVAAPSSVGRKGSPGDRADVEPAEDEIRLRALVRAPQAQRKALSAALHTVAAGRSARKEGGGVRIHVDPLDLF